MHEISLVSRLVRQAEAAARAQGAYTVCSMRVRMGALSGMEPNAFRAAYAIVAKDTLLADAALEIEHVPVQVACPACGQVTELTDPYRLRCAACGASAGEIRQGRELELVSVEVADDTSSP
jgi:hydrogenase nickel incorporation protein HypA/HybF